MIDPHHRKTPSWPEIDYLGTDVVLDNRTGSGYSLKPAFDFICAVLLLVPALPLIGFCWLLVRLGSSGPGLYFQTRSGLRSKNYRIVKLRTMRHNVEAKTGIQWSQKGDSRVTRVGRFLRVTHLDELPQLFNVLRGEMSLVGPRPERPEVIQSKGLAQVVPGYEHRLDVKPGVTGLAQLQLPADSDIASVRHKVAYDLYYIAHQSLWLDLRLIAATLFKAFGFGPERLRKLFFLPSKEDVARSFRGQVTSVKLREPARCLQTV